MEFDINALREIATIVCFLTFAGIVYWAYSKRNARNFEQAAHLPFEQD